MAAMAGDPENWRTCYSVYACRGYEETRRRCCPGRATRTCAKRLVAEAGYQRRADRRLDPADIPQLHAEAAVTEHLLKRLRPKMSNWRPANGAQQSSGLSQGPVAQGGWNVFGNRLCRL